MSVSSNILDMIRRRLKEVAKNGGTVTYGALAEFVNKRDVQNWPELDAIYEEETRAGRPDLTLVVVGSRKPNLPGTFNGRRMKIEDWDEKTLNSYYARRQQLYDRYKTAE